MAWASSPFELSKHFVRIIILLLVMKEVESLSIEIFELLSKNDIETRLLNYISKFGMNQQWPSFIYRYGIYN